MRTAHLSRLRIGGGDLRDLALFHAEWVVGLGRFDALREARLAAGVPKDVTADDIVGDTLKLSFPDADGSVRTSVVRLTVDERDVVIEHIVVRRGDAYLLRAPSADAPDVVLRLLSATNVEPRELAPPCAATVAESDVPALVARIRASDRRMPVVLVSIENGTREPVVDPTELARRLAGMVSVHFLSTVRASHRLKDELIAAGFSEKFGCYNGGVRILWPGIVAGDDPYQHLLLLPVRLFAIPDRNRTEHVAGLLCEMIAEGEDPRAWLREIEAPQRTTGTLPTSTPAPTARSIRPSATPPTRAVVHRPAVQTRIDPPRRDSPELHTVEPLAQNQAPSSRDATPVEAEAPPAEPSVDEHTAPTSPPVAAAPAPKERASARLPSTWSHLADDVLAALDLAAELDRDLEATRRELVEARQGLRRAEQQRDELAEGALVLADVAEATKLAVARFPERLVVLPSAHASAIDSVFRDPERCFRVLVLLAMFGHHDGLFSDVLAKALGHAAEWKPKDSPGTIAKFGAHRTWTDSDGQRKLYTRHVTLGGSVNPQRCLQLYYDVRADGRIEIAWIGEHRPTVGKDT